MTSLGTRHTPELTGVAVVEGTHSALSRVLARGHHMFSSFRRHQNSFTALVAAAVAATSLTGVISVIANVSGSITAPAAFTATTPARVLPAPVEFSAPAPASLSSYSFQLRIAAAKSKAASAVYHTVTRGDTLSAVSQEAYNRSACWPGIYRANKNVIGANPDVIDTGWRLVIPAACDTRPVPTPTAQPVATAYVQHTTSSSASRVSEQAVEVSSASSSFESCVITRESGGNAQIFNASDHYGLFQFSYSTWVAAGGSPSLFGHASAAYQEQVFWKAYGLWGTSPWAPYDHC